MENIKVVCTRKLKSDILKQASAKDFDITDTDYLSITYNRNDALYNKSIASKNPLFITSVHAIKSIKKFYSNSLSSHKKIQCFCIEGSTSQLALEEGYDIIATEPSALSLAATILAHGIKHIIYPCGNIRNNSVQNFFKQNAIDCEEFLVYEKKLLNIKSGVFDAIMFFSPSQIDAFLLGNTLPQNIPAFCIGSTTAEHLKNKKHINIHISPNTSQESMFISLMDYYKKQKAI